MTKKFRNALICSIMATSLVVLSTGCNRGTAYNGTNKVRNDVNEGVNDVKQGGKTIKRDVNNLGNRVMPGTNGNGKLTSNLSDARQVSIINSNCEDIIKDVNNGDWRKAQARLKTVRRCTKNITGNQKISPNGLSGNINFAGTNDAAVNRNLDALIKYVNNLSTACKRKNSYNSRAAANNVTGVCPNLRNAAEGNLSTNLSGATGKNMKKTNRDMNITNDIDKLKYLVRRIMLDAEKNNILGAKVDFRETSRVWSRVDKKLSTTYKGDRVKATTMLTDLKKAIEGKDTAKIGSAAKALLDELDVIRVDFSKQVKPSR